MTPATAAALTLAALCTSGAIALALWLTRHHWRADMEGRLHNVAGTATALAAVCLVALGVLAWWQGVSA